MKRVILTIIGIAIGGAIGQAIGAIIGGVIGFIAGGIGSSKKTPTKHYTGSDRALCSNCHYWVKKNSQMRCSCGGQLHESDGAGAKSYFMKLRE